MNTIIALLVLALLLAPGLALAFFYPWLIITAGVAILITVGGLLFEYYVGQNAES